MDTKDSILGPNIIVNASPDQIYYIENDSIFFQMTLSAVEGINDLQVDHLGRNLKLLNIGPDFFQNSNKNFLGFYYVIDSSERTGDTAFISFQITDRESQIASSLFEYKVAEPIDTASRIFGDQLNPNFGNFISLQNFSIYNSSEAAQNANDIDLIIYKDSILNWVVLSPSVQNQNDTLISELALFNTRKNTRFDPNLFSLANFTGLNNDGILVAQDSVPTFRYMDSISTTRVLYFYTQENKQGLLSLRNFSDTLGNFGTIEIKIQR